MNTFNTFIEFRAEITDTAEVHRFPNYLPSPSVMTSFQGGLSTKEENNDMLLLNSFFPSVSS